MPDGNFEQYQVERTSAYRQMDARLIMWGNIMLRGALAGLPDCERSDALTPVRWTGKQIDAAMALHSRVIRLPEVRQRIVLQVFYRGREAADWDKLDPLQQSGVEAEMCREGLARMRRYNRENAASLVLILRQSEFRTVRIGAVWELCAGEGGAS